MIKSVIKKIVNATGYKISRINPGNRFMPYIKEVNVAGFNLKFWINSEGVQYWYTEENFLLESEQLKKIVRPGDKILDVGCNIGVLSTIMSKLTGDKGKVVALDILPDNCLVSNAQLGLNKVTNCEVLNYGASDTEKDVLVFDRTNSSIILDGRTENSLTVKSAPLDNLRSIYGDFDLLKIDVEGHEVSVFKGAKEMLKNKPRIALELHGPHLKLYNNTSVEELFDAMQIQNYEGFILHKYSNVFEVFDPVKALKDPPLANLFLTPKG